MTSVIKEIVGLLEVLPEEDQRLALEVVKRFALALDSNFVTIKPTKTSKRAGDKEKPTEVEFDLDDIEQFR